MLGLEEHPAFLAACRRWDDEGMIKRLWDGDPTIWGDRSTPELSNRLGWLRLHETIRLRDIDKITAPLLDVGLSDVVLLGMGGSSLAPEVFAATHGARGGYPKLSVLDSTHPHQVRAVRERIDVAHTLFIVASKSGNTLETLSGFRYFWDETRARGQQFIAITDSGTPLQRLAEERQFRAVALTPSDVGGRFSALTAFGLLPSALVGIPLPPILESAAAMAAGSLGEASSNPAIGLGLALGVWAQLGRDKLCLRTVGRWESFPAWLEQLVAESLGKHGRGILPVAGDSGGEAEAEDRLYLAYKTRRPEAVPGGTLPAPDAAGMGGEMLRAEVATAVAGEVLGVNPFDQPDVESAKEHARRALGSPSDTGPGLDVLSPKLGNWIDDLIRAVPVAGYIAVQAFLPSLTRERRELGMVRTRLGDRSGAVTTLGFGPRFLHSTGQFHKGGPPSGVFLQIVDRPAGDIPIPEAETSFGKIIRAQADGDYAALRERGRYVLRLDLGRDRAAGMAALLEALG
ncbi:MAG TPA: glucose-6-phosphate isomerase [Acidimicrobiia bacterium]